MKKIIALLLLISFSTTAIDVPRVVALESLEEKKRGHEFLQLIWDSSKVIDDIEMQSYIKKLGFELVAYSENPNKHFGFFLLDDNSINAFAGSYGYIGVHSGMLIASDSEAELAAVLAHEMSHVTQNHINRFIEKTSKQSYLMTAGLIAAALVGDSRTSQAIAASTVAGIAQKNINFTREHEWEADRIGTEILKESGFDPKGMARFFKKLKDNSNAREFLRSHPLGINRIADSLGRSARHIGTYRKNSFEYLTIKAKLYYLENKNIKPEKNKEVELYIKAYQAFDELNYKTAKEYINKLLAINTSKPTYILAGRIMSKLGDINLAQKYLNKNDEISVYYLANAYLENKKLNKAIAVLKPFLKLNIGTVQAYKLLSTLYVDKGELDRAHMASANALIKQGKLDDAIGRYKHAKTITQSQDLFDILKVKIDNLKQIISLYKSL